MIWVLDASVAVRWLLVEERHPAADEVLKVIVGRPRSFAVPELFSFEVFSVLLRLHPAPANAYRVAILPLLEGGVLRHPITGDLLSAAERLSTLGLTGYDACYAGLAEMLGGKWLTFDAKAHAALAERGISWLLSEGLPPSWPTI